MKRPLALLLVLFLSGAGIAAEKHFSDAAAWAERWESPERDAWQRPLDVIRLLAISPGEVVADLGAGTGYFTRLLAIKVGDRGKVLAVDVAPEMLAYIDAREDIVPGRVETVLADKKDPRLPAGGVDLILTVNTWHHIKKRGRYLERLEQALKADGRMVVVDFRRDGEFSVGPPPSERISREDVVEEFERAGWTLASESLALPYQYYLTFYPPRPATGVFEDGYAPYEP